MSKNRKKRKKPDFRKIRARGIFHDFFLSFSKSTKSRDFTQKISHRKYFPQEFSARGKFPTDFFPGVFFQNLSREILKKL